MSTEVFFLISYVGLIGGVFYKLAQNMKEMEKTRYDSDQEDNTELEHNENLVNFLQGEISNLKNQVDHLEQLNIKLENEIFKLKYSK